MSWPPKPETPGASTDLTRRFQPRGARFYKQGRKVMFEFVTSPLSVIVREATAEDFAQHPDAAAAAGVGP